MLFDDISEVVWPLTLFSEIDMNMLESKISNLKTRGGTNFSAGFKGAYEILANDEDKQFEKRIFFLTDAMPNKGDTKPGSLL